MRLILIVALAIIGLVLDQVACESSSSSEEASSIQLEANNLSEYFHRPPYNPNHYIHPPMYPPPYHHSPTYHHPPVYPPSYHRPPVYPPPYHRPPVYPPPYHRPPMHNDNCHMCTMVVNYVSHYGGSSVYSRSNALHSACSHVAAGLNLHGCQLFVQTYGHQLPQYIVPHGNDMRTCQMIHVC